MFYKVIEAVEAWKDTELKNSIMELNRKHLLDNLDKSLVQVNEESEGNK